MKAKQRHHLKENELAQSIASARDFIETRSRALSLAAFVVFLVAVALAGMVVLRQRTQAAAERLLAEAMVVLDAQVVPSEPTDPTSPTPPPAAMAGTGTYTTETEKLTAAVPKLQAAAEAYPDTVAGVTARYHLAGTLATLGKHQEAAAAYDEVILRGGDGLYGTMARLGKAAEQARAGQHDAAIATYEELAARKDGDVPADAVLMELARTYVAAGKRDEAQKTFTRIVDEHPDSPYAADARQQLETLEG
ncbi:MAG: tetratricopeptide repeat protein [Vicinamibacterales bacterium]